MAEFSAVLVRHSVQVYHASMVAIHAFLIHGMGRTPCSMFKLARHLRQHGIKTHQFGYVPAFEKWSHCVMRLTDHINALTKADPQCAYVLIGHSLGTVLIRGALPHLDRPPQACFLLAPGLPPAQGHIGED